MDAYAQGMELGGGGVRRARPAQNQRSALSSDKK